MDWDGIGTFALFMSSGAIGLGIILLRAYKAKLTAKLEWARLEQRGEAPDYAQEEIRALQEEVRRLSDRVDFSEQLLEGGRPAAGEDGRDSSS